MGIPAAGADAHRTVLTVTQCRCRMLTDVTGGYEAPPFLYIVFCYLPLKNCVARS
uniref:Uncharacterized protein n=1 Tax=Echinococcus granulosus TaxID=6210 RepID=A0A068X5A4_ECHGR|nr:hypothetical protein EgrG_000723500 [Echinococcus granulosus]